MATGRLPDPNTAPLTAKGDLYTYSTVPARLAVGSNGDTLVADSSASTGLRWQGNYAAGKNAIINGDFRIWQRGTTSTPAINTEVFLADRFFTNRNGSGATVTVSQQSFTPGTAPVAGYEGLYFYRYAQTVAGTGGTYLIPLAQKIEDVRNFAGQTMTVSFWAKADASRTITVEPGQLFGSGGSPSVFLASQSINATTSWARYSLTFSVPSVSGKTIGAGSSLTINFLGAVNTVQTLDFWGIQVEAGNTATAFQTATGTLAGELAACQRYLPAIYGATNTMFGYAYSTTGSQIYVKLPVTARVAPTGITVNPTLASNYNLVNQGFTGGTPTSIAFNASGIDFASINITTTAASPTLVTGQPVQFQTLNNNGYILFTGCEL